LAQLFSFLVYHVDLLLFVSLDLAVSSPYFGVEVLDPIAKLGAILPQLLDLIIQLTAAMSRHLLLSLFFEGMLQSWLSKLLFSAVVVIRIVQDLARILLLNMSCAVTVVSRRVLTSVERVIWRFFCNLFVLRDHLAVLLWHVGVIFKDLLP
jgi:hypothetical protein